MHEEILAQHSDNHLMPDWYISDDIEMNSSFRYKIDYSYNSPNFKGVKKINEDARRNDKTTFRSTNRQKKVSLNGKRPKHPETTKYDNSKSIFLRKS